MVFIGFIWVFMKVIIICLGGDDYGFVIVKLE